MSSEVARSAGWILGGWLAALGVVAIVFLADVSPEGGWADLVLTVGLLLGAAGLAAIAVTWVVIRFVLADAALQVIAALVGPPILTAAGIALVRLL